MTRYLEIDGKTIDVDRFLLDCDKIDYEESLYRFVKASWPFVDAAPWQDGWPIEAVCEHLEAVVRGDIRRLIINIPPRTGKSSVLAICFPAWVWALRSSSHTSGPGCQFLYASYAEKLSIRDSLRCRRLIMSPWYQRLWGDRFTLNADQSNAHRFSNDKQGERLISAITSTATGEGANIFCIDDPNATNQSESEATLTETKEWWDGTASTRLNNPRLGAFIIQQQRTGEEDLTGHVLEKNIGEWTHLMLPMHYEPARAYPTSIGWMDPRTTEGQLLWPERFGPAEVDILERTLGPYKCNPAEAPVLMADLTMRPISEIKVGDKIIGFEKRETAEGRSYGRQKLLPTEVLQVHKYKNVDIVKIKLEDGETIRCTPEHRWFTKDRGPSREMYMPASLRSSLARICPPRLPELKIEDAHDAGWLSGFFDGEGTVSICRREGFDASNAVHFYQGSGRNLPLCEKLERVLKKFEFEWSYSEDERKPNKDAPCYGYRTYTLLQGDGISTIQKFLHIVQPTKWRDRLIEGTYRSKFIQKRERVLSIEPDGKEDVYALTTTTGNYVVWGLASANSAGQLEQRPEPAGGGVIKREWWQLWEADTFPPFDYILASLDTAYTLKTENDYSALTVWGVYTASAVATPTRVVDLTGRPVDFDRQYAQATPRVMLMSAWMERLEVHQLVKKVAKTCVDLKVDKVLIESKAAGHSVAQEIRRLYGHENFAVQLYDPRSQDKLARLYSVQHLFAEGLIYAPDKSWADMVITQVGVFPKGRNDDIVDTCSQALRHIRDLGLLQRAPERLYEIEDAQRFEGHAATPLYPGT